MIPPEHTERVLARIVVYRGRRYPLSVAAITGGQVSITPFEQETPRTVFYPGTVTVVETVDGPMFTFG